MLVNVAGARPSQYAVHHALAETPPSYYAEARELLADRVDAFTDALDDGGRGVHPPGGGVLRARALRGFPERWRTSSA